MHKSLVWGFRSPPYFEAAPVADRGTTTLANRAHNHPIPSRRRPRPLGSTFFTSPFDDYQLRSSRLHKLKESGDDQKSGEGTALVVAIEAVTADGGTAHAQVLELDSSAPVRAYRLP